MCRAPSKLDIKKFRAVHALMLHGGTDGERTAAKSAADRLASRAGLTIDEAAALATSQQAQEPATASATRNPFDDFFNTPEFCKDREERAKREAAEREELLKNYGSEDAIFAETERERLLSEAVERLKDWEEAVSADGGADRYVSGLAGCETFYDVDHVPQVVIDAVCQAYPLPGDLNGVLTEFLEWRELYHARCLFEGGEHWPWVEARIAVLQDILDTRPVRNWQDLRARMDWWEETLSWGFHHPDGWEKAFLKRIAADHQILERIELSSVQNRQTTKRRTNAEKAEDVIQLVQTHPEASARDLARRAGVSPQTILNWRQKLGEGSNLRSTG